MGRLKIEWHEPALGMFYDTIEWYKSEMGNTAARRFRHGVLKAVNMLSMQPMIGRRVAIPNYQFQHELRMFVEHRNHLILYYVEGEILHIADIYAAKMSNNFLWL